MTNFKDDLVKLLENSYSPYSGVKVSAIIQTKKGQTFSGVNVENAAYPSGICAERSAIFAAISSGCKKGDIEALHLSSSVKNILYPCGACLQVMQEFFDRDTKIHIYFNNDVVTKSLSELLPNGVTRKDII